MHTLEYCATNAISNHECVLWNQSRAFRILLFMVSQKHASVADPYFCLCRIISQGRINLEGEKANRDLTSGGGGDTKERKTTSHPTVDRRAQWGGMHG
jgi:hypothetical protein